MYHSRFGSQKLKREVRFGRRRCGVRPKVSIKGAAAGSGQTASEKEWTNKDCPRKVTLPSGQRSYDAQLSKRKECMWVTLGKPVQIKAQLSGPPLKLHLNRGLAGILQR
jgi:hypothetical protein